MESKQDINHPFSHLANHPTEGELAAFWNPSLGGDALERLAVHLDSCASCRSRLERMEPALSQYSRCLDAVHAQVPLSRGKNAALRTLTDRLGIDRLETTGERDWFPSSPFKWQWVGLAGIAAAVVACVVLLSWSGDPTELRAEALLTQASTAPAQKAPHHRLRVRTRTALYVRNVPEQREVALVRARFDQANYDWRDPLSAQSYSTWRHTLKHKTSKVLTTGVSATGDQSQQQIETATDAGTLRKASLTFDATLAPVSGMFQFSDREWVEITAMPDADQTSASLVPAPVSAPSAAGASENVPREPLAERELDVRLAINVLHTGASEPIEVSTSSGDILVTTYHLTAAQEKKLELSLKQINGVTLRALDESTEQRPGAYAADPTGLLLQTSQDLAFEAHFLAELADRFQPAIEATLSQAALQKLWNLRASHLRDMNRTLSKLQQRLEATSPDFHVASGDSVSEPSGAGIQGLADRASALDRLIILLSASSDASPERAAIWPRLSSEFAHVRALDADYSRIVEEGRKRHE